MHLPEEDVERTHLLEDDVERMLPLSDFPAITTSGTFLFGHQR